MHLPGSCIVDKSRHWHLALAIALLCAITFGIASCGGGGGGSPIVSPSPEIPIVRGDDHGDSRADATALTLGGSVSGAIETGDDEDYFRVDVTEPGTLTVYTTGVLNTLGELQAGDGSILATDDNSGTDNHFNIEHYVGPGTYYVKVSGYEYVNSIGVPVYFTGAYIVHARFVAGPADDHGNTMADATALTLGGSVSGAIETGDDEDYFRVEVAEPGTLTVHTTGNIDTLGELQASDGAVLASDDDGGNDSNFRIEFDVGPGTYFVKVGSDATATGSYALLARFTPALPADDHGDSRADATALTLEGSLRGEIEESEDEDFFRLEVTEPGTLTVYTIGNLDTVGELQDADGTVLAGSNDGGDQNFRIERFVSAGTYYVKVTGHGMDTGAYRVFASFEADNSDTITGAAAVPVGGSVSARIDRPDDVDVFRLPIAQSGTLVVWTTGAAATNLVLLDSSGNELRSTMGSSGTTPNVSSREILVQAGTTVIARVTGRGGVGSYSLVTRNVRTGQTNVVADFPRIRLAARNRYVYRDMAEFFATSQAQGELKYNASIETPAKLRGVPLGVDVAFSTSVLRITSEVAGPFYGGIVGITIEVRDLFGLFARKVLDLEFFRKNISPWGRCVAVGGERNNCSSNAGTVFTSEITNNCIRPVKFVYFTRSPPHAAPSSGEIALEPGRTASLSSDCITGNSAGMFTCVYVEDESPLGCNPCGGWFHSYSTNPKAVPQDEQCRLYPPGLPAP